MVYDNMVGDKSKVFTHKKKINAGVRPQDEISGLGWSSESWKGYLQS